MKYQTDNRRRPVQPSLGEVGNPGEARLDLYCLCELMFKFRNVSSLAPGSRLANCATENRKPKTWCRFRTSVTHLVQYIGNTLKRHQEGEELGKCRGERPKRWTRKWSFA